MNNLTPREKSVINTQYRGNSFDSKRANGDIVLRDATGGYQVITAKTMQSLTQRNDHVHQDHIESNADQVRGTIASNEIVRDGYDASVKSENPFHGMGERGKLQASTFGSPSNVRSNKYKGLPSDRDPQHHGLPSNSSESRHAKAATIRTGAGGLPSAQRK